MYLEERIAELEARVKALEHREIFNKPPKQCLCDTVLAFLSAKTGISVNGIKCKLRTQNVCIIRSIFCRFIYEMSKDFGNPLSTIQIGEYLSDRHPGTILNALRQAQNLIDTNKQWRERVTVWHDELLHEINGQKN